MGNSKVYGSNVTMFLIQPGCFSLTDKDAVEFVGWNTNHAGATNPKASSLCEFLQATPGPGSACVDSTTYVDGKWGDNCAAWIGYECTENSGLLPAQAEELQMHCPIACQAGCAQPSWLTEVNESKVIKFPWGFLIWLFVTFPLSTYWLFNKNKEIKEAGRESTCGLISILLLFLFLLNYITKTGHVRRNCMSSTNHGLRRKETSTFKDSLLLYISCSYLPSCRR